MNCGELRQKGKKEKENKCLKLKENGFHKVLDYKDSFLYIEGKLIFKSCEKNLFYCCMISYNKREKKTWGKIYIFP